MKVNLMAIKGGKEAVVTTLALRGGRVVAEPESPLVKKILAQTVFDPVRQDSIDARSDPERFLEILPFNYRSPYFWAAVAPDAEEDAEEDDDENGPEGQVTAPLLFPGDNQDGSPEG